MILRATTATLGLAAAAVLLSGCLAPAPEPTPTPTAVFASEDEAFAAAEETYRAYVDAGNNVDLADPATFEPMFAWTTGELNASDRKSFSAWHANGTSIAGDAEVTKVEPNGVSLEDPVTVDLLVCYDVSSIDVRDRDGNSLITESRQKVQPLSVELQSSKTSPTGLKISSIHSAPDDFEC